MHLTLTETGYEHKDALDDKKDSHVAKILDILVALIKNGPSSKWDLSTVKYRNTIKNGFTPYSWVLIHKLISEMLKLRLIEKKGKSVIDANDKKNKKKHVVDLYFLTRSGLAFTICADMQVYQILNQKINPYQKGKKNSKTFLSLYSIVWDLKSISVDASKEIRKLTMNNIVTKNLDNEVVTIIESIVSYTVNVVEKIMSKDVHLLESLESSESSELMKIASLKNALSNFKGGEVRGIIALALIHKIMFFNFGLKIIKWFYNDIQVPDPELGRLKSGMEITMEQIFLKLSAITTLSSTTLLMRSANNYIESIKKLTSPDAIERVDANKKLEGISIISEKEIRKIIKEVDDIAEGKPEKKSSKNN